MPSVSDGMLSETAIDSILIYLSSECLMWLRLASFPTTVVETGHIRFSFTLVVEESLGVSLARNFFGTS